MRGSACVVVLVLAGCVDAEVGGSVVVLEGGAIGLASIDNALLVRDVELQAGAVPAPLKLGAASASWPGEELEELGSVVDVFVAVDNIGDALVCNIIADGFTLTDADGGPVADGLFMFLTGSSGLAVPIGDLLEVADNACIAPGETAWLHSLHFNTPLESVARLQLGDLLVLSDAARAPRPKIVPESYDATLNAGLRVTVKNDGDEDALFTGATAIILDDDDRPMGRFDLLASDDDSAPVLELVVPERRRARASFPMLFRGLASRLHVSPHFTEVGTTPAL